MNDTKKIGQQLVKHSRSASAFSAHRGVMDELFPFIYEASLRMSLRAIGRWLKSEHHISVSANTLARAMRNPEKYWIHLLLSIEPSVRIVARCHGVRPAYVLSSRDVILQLESVGLPVPPVVDEEAEYDAAVVVVKEFWSWMPPESMAKCLACVGKVFKDDDSGEHGE